jgi:hypothetical protein
MVTNTRYRAIRTYNGGEKTELAHFQNLKEAYEWLTPSLSIQEQERWHIKVLPVIRQEFETYNPNYLPIGFNSLRDSSECSLYIQIVQKWDTPLPRF